jgi:hypothetical protein
LSSSLTELKYLLCLQNVTAEEEKGGSGKVEQRKGVPTDVPDPRPLLARPWQLQQQQQRRQQQKQAAENNLFIINPPYSHAFILYEDPENIVLKPRQYCSDEQAQAPFKITDTNTEIRK